MISPDTSALSDSRVQRGGPYITARTACNMYMSMYMHMYMCMYVFVYYVLLYVPVPVPVPVSLLRLCSSSHSYSGGSAPIFRPIG